MQAEKNRQSSTVRVGGIEQAEEGDDFIPLFGAHVLESTQDHKERINAWINNVAMNLSATMALYNEGLELGIAKECARMILPMTSQTTIYMTGSVRSWIHFLQIRDDGHAQLEVQLVAKEIKGLFKQQLPIISEALNF